MVIKLTGPPTPAGTGKSVLSSLIIDRLTTEAPSPEEAPIYFYIDFRNTAKTKVANIYRSLCVQLLSHFVDLPDELEARYDKQKMENLYEQELLDILHLLVEKAKTPTTVVIDALDECETRNDFMNAMVELPEKTRIRLLVTSRENVDIKHKFANQPTVQIRPELTKHDITLYVTEEVKRHARLGALSSDTREKVISTISSGADGM